MILRVDTVTNEVGQYRVPNLPVGAYKISFEAKGFKTSIREGLTLGVTDVLRVDARLELGATTESLTVTGEVPILQTETPEVGTLLTTKQVMDLPLGFSGGRYAENFAYKLTAGVGGDNWTAHINGAPSFSKEVVLDGASAIHLHQRTHGRIQPLHGSYPGIQGTDQRHERRIHAHVGRRI